MDCQNQSSWYMTKFPHAMDISELQEQNRSKDEQNTSISQILIFTIEW